MTVDASQSGLTENAASGLAYITFIPAIIFLVTEPYNRSPLVRFHSWQSIFLTIAWVVAYVGISVLLFVPFVGWLILLLLKFLIWLGFFIFWLIALINAFNGKRFKLPILGDLAEKQANS